jgi:hypothetical protein
MLRCTYYTYGLLAIYSEVSTFTNQIAPALAAGDIIVETQEKEPAKSVLLSSIDDSSSRSSSRSSLAAGSISGCNSNAEEPSYVTPVYNKENSLSQIDVVIGLDFGTTYSGFAYAANVSGDPEIKVFYDWPSKTDEKPYCKTLTGLYYKRAEPGQLECASWGHLARSDYMDQRGSQHGGQGSYFTKFKLLLNKEYLNDPETLAKSIPSPLTATTIITDYLKHIGELALKVVGDYVKEAELGRYSVQWCLTVPSIWDENAKQQMRECLVKAGLVPAGVDAVRVVLEPEAASFHCHQNLLREKRKDVSLHAKDKILVVDVGGGTVDIVVQGLIANGEDQFMVKELTQSSGGLCGGTFVDERFMRFMYKKIGCLDEFLRNDSPSYMSRLLKDWEEIKCAFGRETMFNTETKEINLHAKLAVKWEAYERERGFALKDSSIVELTDQDLKSIFDPVVEKILHLISAQLTQVLDIKAMFVVGGFAESPYLMQRIRARFSGEVLHIKSPPTPGSAVVQGAVALALHPDAIVSRIAKKTYGTNVIMSFDHNLDREDLLKETNGRKYCRNRFDVFVRRGSRVDFDKDVTKEYRPHSDGQTQMRFDLYSSTEVNPRYTDEPTVTKEGEFKVTLPEKFSRRDLMFKFTMYFGRSSIELRAEAQFKHGRGRKVEKLELPVEYYS